LIHFYKRVEVVPLHHAEVVLQLLQGDGEEHHNIITWSKSQYRF